MKRPAIVIPAFNRAEVFKRLLSFIEKASYTVSDIPLVISIDGGGSQDVIDIAEAFAWNHGPKEVIRHERNLGLRNHILYCGDLTQKYGAIIMLEDDLLVGPGFYNYSFQAINAYVDDHNIAGISLYSYRNNENASFVPFFPIDNGYNAFFMQVPSSWGQAWTDTQWAKFRDYYETCLMPRQGDLLPLSVIEWPESSWKKYFFKYIVEKDLYIVYPYLSHSSNWGEIGTHFTQPQEQFRVQLSMVSNATYRFPSFAVGSVAYDAFFELKPDYFKAMGFCSDVDFGVDLYGTKDLSLYSNALYLSSKASDKIIRQFGMEMLPIELNVLCDIKGCEITLAERTSFSSTSRDVVKELSLQCFRNTYEYGFGDGFREGQLQKAKTLSYKVGRVVTSPYRFIHNILHKE